MENRIYKFRAWDIFSKKFIYSNKQCMDNMGEVGNIDERPFKKLSIFFDRIDDEPDRFILMQWTGLNDMNGKEIYEGDKVKITGCSSGLIKEVNLIETIEDIREVYSEFGIGNIGEGMQLEIIGNIYENPELIKESEGK